MKDKGENGAIMLESTYCVLGSIIVCMFLISFGFFLYQKSLVTIVTNEIGKDISQTYKLMNVEDSSQIWSQDVSKVGKYRYFWFNSKFEARNTIKARNLVNVRLTQTSLAKEIGQVWVEIETVVDDIGRRHYEVTVKQRYSFLLGDLLQMVGIDSMPVISSTCYVESSDVLNYVNTVKTTKYAINEVKELSSVIGLIDSVFDLIHNTFQD